MTFARVKINLKIVLEEMIDHVAASASQIQQETTQNTEKHPNYALSQSNTLKPKQIVIQGGITHQIQTQQNTPTLPPDEHRRKLIKQILKKEKLLKKICLKCFHNTTRKSDNQTTDSEARPTESVQYEEITMGALLDNYLSILAPNLAQQPWNKPNNTNIQEEAPGTQQPPHNPSDPMLGRLYYLSSMSQRKIFKFKDFKDKSDFKRKIGILEFVKNHGGRVSNALENVCKSERAQFIREYLDIAVQQMQSAKNLVPNSFTYFYDINYWEHGRYSTFLKTLRKVKQSLETENDLSEFDALLAKFVTGSQKIPISQDSNQNALGKRDDTQFQKSGANLEESKATEKLKAIMERRAGRLEKFQTRKTNRILKEILHIMMSKFSKKLFLVEEYEKMLLHEDLVLDLKFNEILASKFMENSN